MFPLNHNETSDNYGALYKALVQRGLIEDESGGISENAAKFLALDEQITDKEAIFHKLLSLPDNACNPEPAPEPRGKGPQT